MVKGLEDEDVEFLSAIDQKKMEDERKVKEQERLELEEFRFVSTLFMFKYFLLVLT